MNDCQKMRTTLKNIDSFLSHFQDNIQRSSALEQLFTQAMSLMFHLPYFDSATDFKNTVNKVVWLGQDGKTLQNAPANGSDAIVYARDFDVLLEITECTGTKQWDREFSRSVKHLDGYIAGKQKKREDVYLLLVAKEICSDMFHSIRAKVDLGSNIIMLTFKDVDRILEVCGLTIGLRHIELKELFSSLARDALDTPVLSNYNRKAMRTISDWRKSLLKSNQLAYVGIQSYKLFKTLTPMTRINASYLATELYTQKEIKAYFKILKEPLVKEYVHKGMLTLGFACEFGIKQIDPILTIVSTQEIEERIREILLSINN